MVRLRRRSSWTRNLSVTLFLLGLTDEGLSFVGKLSPTGRLSAPTAFEPSQNIQHSFWNSIVLHQGLGPSETTSNSTFLTSLLPKDESPSLASTVQKREPIVDDKMILIMMTLIFVVGSLSSLDRVAMSIAMVPMTEEYGYTDSTKGSISSLFSVGYGLGILPSGLLISSLSPRTVMAVGIAFWSIGTIASPFAAAQTSMGYLLVARALVGASESVVIPTVQKLLSNWIPPEKKSLAVATVFAGLQSGTILAYSLSPYLIDKFENWRVLFYLYGGAGLLYLVPWLLLAKDGPEQSFDGSAITAEKQSTSIVADAKEIFGSAPWKDLVTSKGVWGMFFAHAANNWGLYNNLSWTPTFYKEQYGLNVQESAILLIIPSIAGAIGGLSAGVIADKAIQSLEDRTDEAITNVRKGFQGVALFGPSICLGTLAYTMPQDPTVAQSLFTIAIFLQSFNAAGYGAANQEKAGEKWTGLLYGITSLPSVVIGTVGVSLTGTILDSTNQNWSIVFGLNSIVYLIGAVAFVALYDSKREFD